MVPDSACAGSSVIESADRLRRAFEGQNGHLPNIAIYEYTLVGQFGHRLGDSAALAD